MIPRQFSHLVNRPSVRTVLSSSRVTASGLFSFLNQAMLLDAPSIEALSRRRRNAAADMLDGRSRAGLAGVYQSLQLLSDLMRSVIGFGLGHAAHQVDQAPAFFLRELVFKGRHRFFPLGDEPEDIAVGSLAHDL